jgi:hypothetical protein
MRFVKPGTTLNTSDTTRVSLVPAKGKSMGANGKVSHHPRGKWSSNKERPPTQLNFIGVDGEGMTLDGEHRYVLFGVGEKQIEDPNGLDWKRVFEFLYQVHTDAGKDARRNAYVGFFLGYDFTQIFKTLPEDRARMLLTKEGRQKRAHRELKNGTLQNNGRKGMPPHPVECDGWQFDILGMKRLRIRPKMCDCEFATCKCDEKKASWMYICDVGSYFQTSFLKVIDPAGWAEGTQIVTDEEWKIIQEGKGKRSTAVLDEEMRMYNRLENKVLSRVMATLNTGFHGIGINLSPAKWFGPGQAAQAWLKKEGVPTREDLSSVLPLRMVEAARASYFGGWFEIMMHGIIPGDTHEYDINSAYPAIIAKLPCLQHGIYSYGEGLPPANGNSYTLVYANLESPVLRTSWKWKDQHIGAMLHRENGGISRPMMTEGWFWWHELKAAEKAKVIKRLDNQGYQQVQKWVSYVPCGCLPPMAGIEGLYQTRLAVGKESPLGKAAKLVYNSAYGKFAQSEGMNPIFGNAIYASLITAGCRTQILEAIASHPYGKADIAMVATDAVYFLHEHPTLSVSSKLGEWDYKARRDLTLFKPGVYWDDITRERIANGDNPNFKARGFKASDFVTALGRIDQEFREWDLIDGDVIKRNNQNGVGLPGVTLKTEWNWPSVKFTPTFVMTTALQALQRNKWEIAGRVQTEVDAQPIEQNSDPWQKRNKVVRDTYRGRQIYRSLPHDFKYGPSEPYDKHFGMDDPWSDEYKAQMGETQEGRVMDILSWILKGD